MPRLVATAIILGSLTVAAPAMAAFGCFYKRIDEATFTRINARNPTYVRTALGAEMNLVSPAARDDIARAESGDPDAQYGLAKRFAAGDDVPQNYEIALLLMQESLQRISGDTRDEAVCFASGVQQLLAARSRTAPVAIPSKTR